MKLLSRNTCNDRALLSRGRSRLKRSGFTLVEVMVAMVCIGIVFVAAFTSVGRGTSMVEGARDLTRVSQILQSEIEDLRMLSWSELTAQQASSGGDWTAVALDSDFQALFGARYTVERKIAPRYSGGVALLDQKQIEVRVTWIGMGGLSRSRKTATWFTEGGLHDYHYRSF